MLLVCLTYTPTQCSTAKILICPSTVSLLKVALPWQRRSYTHITHYNTLQHTATHCNTPQHTDTALNGKDADVLFYSVDHIQKQLRMIAYTESTQSNTPRYVEIGSGLSGNTAATGCVSRVSTTCSDRRFNLQMDTVTPTVSAKASLWMPMRNLDGHVTGVVGVYVDKTDDLEGGVGSTVLRLCHEFGPYFSDLVYLDALEVERKHWKAINQQILHVFDSPEVSACVDKVKATFIQLFRLGRCQQWIFDPKGAMLTYSPGRGAGKYVEISVNGQQQLCKSARSGDLFVAPVAAIHDDPMQVREDLASLPNSSHSAQMVVPLMDSSHKPILVVQVTLSSLPRSVSSVSFIVYSLF